MRSLRKGDGAVKVFAVETWSESREVIAMQFINRIAVLIWPLASHSAWCSWRPP